MRRATMVIALFCGALWLAAAACGDEGPSIRSDGSGPPKDSGNGTPDGGGPPPGKTLTFIKNNVDVEKAGEYSAVAAGGGKVGVAYYRALSQPEWPTVTCKATAFGPGGPKARPGHDLLYIESTDGGATFGAPVAVDQTINAAFGVSLTYSSDGSVHVGYLGGAEANLSLQECQSSDAMIASSSDGKTFNKTTVFVAGPVGDSVGHWTSVAVDPSGSPHAAYRDVGFGLYEQIGIEKSELRYDTGGEAIDEDTGGGIYATLKFDSAGNPVIMHFNGMRTDTQGGIQLAYKKGGWQTKQLVAGGTIERPDLDTDGNGTWGLAWHDPKTTALKYIESKDLENWSQPLLVDLSTTFNGGFASLAYDSRGNPAISYYRCGPASAASATSCQLDQDGLMFAYRIDGKWTTYEVDDGKAFACGDQTSLSFNDQDEPVISYRCVTLRNQDNQFVDTLKVARGVWK